MNDTFKSPLGRVYPRKQAETPQNMSERVIVPKNTRKSLLRLRQQINYVWTKANELLRKLEKNFTQHNMPEVGKLEKFEVPGATFTIVHIGWSHQTRAFWRQQIQVAAAPDPAKAIWQQAANDCADYIDAQNGVYLENIFQHLIQNFDMHALHLEGLTETGDDDQKTLDAYAQKYRELATLPDIEQRLTAQKALGRHAVKNFSGIPLGVLLENNVAIVPAEEAKVSEKTSETMKKHDDIANKTIEQQGAMLLDTVNIIETEREKAVIRQLAAGSGEMRFVLLGNDHDMRQELLDWNKKNPTKRASYVRLTPAYERTIEKYIEQRFEEAFRKSGVHILDR